MLQGWKSFLFFNIHLFNIHFFLNSLCLLIGYIVLLCYRALIPFDFWVKHLGIVIILCNKMPLWGFITETGLNKISSANAFMNTSVFKTVALCCNIRSPFAFKQWLMQPDYELRAATIHMKPSHFPPSPPPFLLLDTHLFCTDFHACWSTTQHLS